MSLFAMTRHDKRRKLAVSLTPLIDVVFILLVFFMLASSFQKERTVEMVTPPEARKAVKPQVAPVVLIQVEAGGYRVKGQLLTIEILEQRLQNIGSSKVVIKTMADAEVQHLVSLMDLVAHMALPQVSLLSYQEGG